MKSLRTILTKYSSEHGPLGEKGATPAPVVLTPEQERALLSDLEAISKGNGRIAIVIVVLLVILFVVCVSTVLAHKADPGTAKAMLAGLGISSTGCIWYLIALWREKTATELLLRLAVSFRGAVLQQIVDVLAKQAKLSKPSMPHH